MTYEITLLTVMGINVILAMSLNLITGFCGQISLGHAAFYGIGAYAAALFTTAGGPVWVGVVLAMAVAGIFGLIVGLTSLRVRDDFLAITTMGVGFLFIGIVRQQEALGGEIGITGIPDAGLGKPGYMLLTIFLAAMVIAFSIYVKRSWMGFAFDAIAADEDTARTVGIDAARFKLTAFILGTGIAGLAGALYAHHVKYVGIDGFGFVESISVLVMVIVGGIGSIWGVSIAAAVLSVLPLWLQFIADYKMLFYGVLLLLIMRFAPGGLDSLLRNIFGFLVAYIRRSPTSSRSSLTARRAEKPMPILASPRGSSAMEGSRKMPATPAQWLGSKDQPPGPTRDLMASGAVAAGPLLKVEDLSVNFGGVVALDQVWFSVDEGELVGLIGPNGAGKTTLLRVVTGAVRPTSGRVYMANRDISRLAVHSRARLGLGLSHQIARPFENMTVLGNVALAAGSANTSHPMVSIFRMSRAEALEKAETFLDLVGIADAANAEVRELPLGYLKRLGVARALALEPRILLLDEPLAGLNHVEAKRMADTILRINADGLTTVVIEHNLSEVVRISDRLTVLDNGRVLAEGDPGTVIANPAVRDAYMGSEGAAVAAS